MTYADLLKKTDSELKKTLAEKREALRGFRFSVSGSKVTNVKEGRNLKKEVARLMTALREKVTSATV